VNHLDAARWTTWEAIWKLDSGRPAAASVHLAKVVTAQAHIEACNAAHEVHAGIGSSLEYGLVPSYLKNAGLETPVPVLRLTQHSSAAANCAQDGA
jgi:alkylation response protein AidB-like acyl-CoA dehydrogenase